MTIYDSKGMLSFIYLFIYLFIVYFLQMLYLNFFKAD